ncbi:MAG: RNA-binding transcriptional accessory protein [Crocinitomicaceae bacterium]|nr:RNA-binding transcriptional accessory protein [Crocinitomicaceae bacterium]
MSLPFQLIAENTGFSQKQLRDVYALFNDGATLPFVARYRKDRTGGIDEVGLEKISDQFALFEKIKLRKQTILEQLNKKDNVSKNCIGIVKSSWNLTEIEDVYLPYKEQKKTKASLAIDAGLGGLAKQILTQVNPVSKSQLLAYKTDNYDTIERISLGVKEILIKWIAERKNVRFQLREKIWNQGMLVCNEKKSNPFKDQPNKYIDYYNFSEPLKKIKSHRFLAINRGVNEGVLASAIDLDKSTAINIIKSVIVDNQGSLDFICSAVEMAWSKSLKPSLQKEVFKKLKLSSDLKAIGVFSDNLRQLLLMPPLKQKRLLAIDPGFKSGCKLVCLSESGELLGNATIYPHPPKNDVKSAKKKIVGLIDQYKLDGIALGNGTASRETERLIKGIRFNRKINVYIVNEAGASVYSASSIARKEFPSYDVTVRGAVSIGRRLIDPLSELVKIDPKSIGVGQYQHDVDQNLLEDKLVKVVSSVVNYVGVDLNTASEYLLTYVSGIGPKLAKKIIDYRTLNGGFSSREELLRVSGLGKVSFEQSAGFLRIKNGDNVLDDSGVHPEFYDLLSEICNKEKIVIDELIGNSEKVESVQWSNYSSGDFQDEAIADLKRELLKPGADPRKVIYQLEFDSSIKSINDVKVGQIFPGIINNVTNFGAFVDIGIKENGLIHISHLANQYIDDPTEIVQVHQHVRVKVISIDVERKRIGLSLKDV